MTGTEPAYDAIAAEYQKVIGTLPERRLLGYNLEIHEGDVAGKSVLDLACGTGEYTRTYKARGAARVVGVDVSARMIDFARVREAAAPLGIEYRTGDVAELGTIGAFDLVTAFGLLHYAASREALYRMCRNIAANLRPGGRFVTANKNVVNPAAWTSDPAGWARFNVRPGAPGGRPLREGERTTTRLHWQGTEVQFDVYFFARETYEDALRAAGLRCVAWHDIVLPPWIESEPGGRAHWQYLIDHSYMVILEAER